MYHFVRERVERNEVHFEFVPTDKMVADVFTKALALPKFKFCLQDMGMI